MIAFYPGVETLPSSGAITVYVCTSCRPPGEDSGLRPGMDLYERLTKRIAERGLAGRIRLAPVECLSVCKRPATVAVTGGDRWTYVFGDIDADGDLDGVVSGLLAFAGADNGIVPWRERPEFMKRGVVARIPPFPGASVTPSASLTAVPIEESSTP